MSDIQITAKTREAAMQEALERLSLPEEALEVEWSVEQDDLLASARPYVQMNVRIRLDYVANKVVECVQTLLEKMQMEATVSSECISEMVLVKIESPQQEVLIGYHGETLDALQQIVLRMTRLNGREMPLILVDVGNYRGRRIQRLRRVAHDLAASVLENGKEEFFDPMDSIDRKILHTILKEIKGIKTYSRGENASRHVIVAPAD